MERMSGAMFPNWSERLPEERIASGSYRMLYVHATFLVRFGFSPAYQFTREHIERDGEKAWYAPPGNFLMMVRSRYDE